MPPFWFPTTRDSSTGTGWRFDIVGLLAVIGESTIAEHVQSITASPFSYVPRLIPAPQTLLKTKRPQRLPSVKNVVVVGVHSGTLVDELNYFANAVHDVEGLEEFEFREWEISYRDMAKREMKKRIDTTVKPDDTVNTPSTTTDPEKGPNIKHTTSHPHPNTLTEKKIHIHMRTLSALNLITLGSLFMTICLFVWAALIHDGVACIAIAAISASTSLACLSSGWVPQICERPSNAEVPPGDIAIVTRGRAITLVHCDEEITRELYTAADKCDYVARKWWPVLVASSTILLMIAVVLLSNCGWTMQAAIGVSYIILNAAYWGLPFVTKVNKEWDLDQRYIINEIKHRSHDRNRLLNVDRFGNRPSATRTIAYAIKHTKFGDKAPRNEYQVDWLTAADILPKTPAWQEWLKLARENSNNPLWDPVRAKDNCMRAASGSPTAQAGQGDADREQARAGQAEGRPRS